jgi:hypothetical protein
MAGVIQEVVAVEVKLRFKNETYDFYLTGLLLLPLNFSTDHLRRAAHYIITQNTPPQMSIERTEIIAKIQCSQDFTTQVLRHITGISCPHTMDSSLH